MPENRQHVLQSIIVRSAHGLQLRQPGHLGQVGVQQLLLLALQLAWVAGYKVAAEDRWS